MIALSLPPFPYRKYINIRHPFHHDDVNIIIRLPALDLPDDVQFEHTPDGKIAPENYKLHEQHAGIHRVTLLAVLFILTSRPGALHPCRLESAEETRKRRKLRPRKPKATEASDEDILLQGDYYYYTGNGDRQRSHLRTQMLIHSSDSYRENPSYSVVESFRQWTFPRENLPQFLVKWKESMTNDDDLVIPVTSDMSDTVRMRDGGCKATGCPDGTEAAHLVPKEEGKWSLHNRPIRMPQTIAFDYMLSRMAWTAFKLVNPSLGISQRATSDAKINKDTGSEEDTKVSSKPSNKPQRGEEEYSRKRKKDDAEDTTTQLERDEQYLESLFPEGTFDGEVPIANLSREQQLTLANTSLYPGFSRINRMKESYKTAHPEITTVADTKNVWEEPEEAVEDRESIVD
ncbi:hypothetical protein Dda_5185 [Drechslerella dactyloides]|uniref:HNH nuclease domain-containing protein n=1 Tax=Drechslerella dactyloides TaxID=74499 RepID=A0AAD6IVL8_DREDA|nr:hypothetical protein Dda_5185 [Drechslerella dactyloides]